MTLQIASLGHSLDLGVSTHPLGPFSEGQIYGKDLGSPPKDIQAIWTGNPWDLGEQSMVWKQEVWDLGRHGIQEGLSCWSRRLLTSCGGTLPERGPSGVSEAWNLLFSRCKSSAYA